MRLTVLSARATAAEHGLLLAATMVAGALGAVPLPIPLDLELRPDAALMWACVIAGVAGACLRGVMPTQDGIPRDPLPGWALGRLSLICVVMGLGLAVTWVLGPSPDARGPVMVLARNLVALTGLTLVLRASPWPVWGVAPWLWTGLALIAGRGPAGAINWWALPVMDPGQGWMHSALLLGLGTLVVMAGEFRIPRPRLH